MEYSANNFAAEILMPENKILEFFWEGHKIDEMAQNFEVSLDALRVRLRLLGLDREPW